MKKTSEKDEDWQPEEMSLEDEVLGRFSIKAWTAWIVLQRLSEAVLPKGKQRFQILRNRDWRQMIYPESPYADQAVAVQATLILNCLAMSGTGWERPEQLGDCI